MDTKKIEKQKFYRKYRGLIFVSPWLLGFCIFSVIPSIASLYMSMTDWGVAGPIEGFVGFKNYINAFTNSQFWDAIIVTVKFVIFGVPLGMVGSLVAALLLNNDVRGNKMFRAFYYLPVVSSGVAIAVMWMWILAPEGLLNMFLGTFGIEPIFWLNDPDYVIPSYVIIAVWSSFSGYLTYLVAIKDVPGALYENSKIIGVGYFENLFKITIPLIRPILTYNLIMAIIASFRKFSDAYVIGGAGGQGKFYMVYFYEVAFRDYKMGYAIALAWILVFIIFILVAIVYKQTPFFEYYSGKKELE